MSLSYNGTSSFLQSSVTQAIGTLFSAALWIKPTGDANLSHVFAQGPFNGNRISLRWVSPGTRTLQVRSQWASNGEWSMTTGFDALDVWLWVGVTFDATLATNKPILYTLVGSVFSILTVGAGLTEISAPSGAIGTTAQPFYLGKNNAGDFSAGLIGEFAFWTRINSAAEMAAVAFNGVNSCPDHFNYLPQDSGRVQNLGSSGTAFTATSLTTGENPPVRPAGRRG